MTSINVCASKAILCKYMSLGEVLAKAPEIINNNQNQKQTSVCVGWVKDKERLFGSPALNNKRNMQWTFNNLTRLIGLTNEEQEQIDKEKMFCLADLKQDDDAKPYFQSHNEQLYIEQIMGAFLRNLNKNFGDKEERAETIVTYPNFFNQR